MKILAKRILPKPPEGEEEEVVRPAWLEQAVEVTLVNGVAHVGGTPLVFDSTDKYVSFFRNQSGEVVKVDASWLANQREAAALARSKFHIADIQKDLIARCWLDFDTGPMIVVSASKLVKENPELVEQAPSKTELAIFADHYPEALEMFNKWKARRDHLFDVSPNESLSALEKQVDLLTDLLYALLPEDQKPLLAGFLNLSCCDCANTEAIEKSLAFKQRMRECVANYEASKSGTE